MIPPPAQPGYADLIRQARQGDDSAWELLVRAHQQPVFRLAYLFLGDADEAEDVAQETFIRAYHSFNRFDAERPLRPWLLKIAANLARNRHRSMGRYLGALGRLLHSEAGLPRSPVEDASALRQRSQELWRAVRKLDETGQQVIYLRYFLDLPVDETAETLGIAAGTVKSRLHRALSRLRQVIEKEAPGLKDWSDGREEL